jgi:hypothetical protein
MRSGCWSACSTSRRPMAMGSAWRRSREVPSITRTLPIGGRGSYVPVEVAPLGRGASAVVPLARDGRSVSDLDRGGPPAAFAREDRRDGLRTTLRAVAGGRCPFTSARRLDSVGHPTTWAGAASGHPESARQSCSRTGAGAGFDGRAHGTSGRRQVRGECHARRCVRAACPGGRRCERPSLPPVLRLGGGCACRVGQRTLGRRVEGNTTPADSRVELGGAGSGRLGVSPEGSTVRGVSAPDPLCLVNGPIGLSQRSVLSSGLDHMRVIIKSETATFLEAG